LSDNEEYDNVLASIKDNVVRLKTVAKGMAVDEWQSAMTMCSPDCIKCNSTCAVRSQCTAIGCEGTCVCMDAA
jgi:hypothetical protein